MSEIDTSPDAVAFRVNLAKQIARDAGGNALSISLDRTAAILEALAADRDRLATENARLEETAEALRAAIEYALGPKADGLVWLEAWQTGDGDAMRDLDEFRQSAWDNRGDGDAAISKSEA